MKTNNSEQKIDQVLESITQGYERLERIESDLEDIRRKRGEMYFNRTNQGDKA